MFANLKMTSEKNASMILHASMISVNYRHPLRSNFLSVLFLALPVHEVESTGLVAAPCCHCVNI